LGKPMGGWGPHPNQRAESKGTGGVARPQRRIVDDLLVSQLLKEQTNRLNPVVEVWDVEFFVGGV